MDSNIDLILRLEKLANLQLQPDERTAMSADLQKMVAMIDQLSTLDTKGVEPLVYLNEPCNPLREDVAQPPIDASIALIVAPDREGPYFKVPKVSSKPSD